MNNVNRVIMVGSLGHDPELRHTNKGSAVTTLSLATTRSSKSEDGSWKEDTEWHRAVIWGKRAETCVKYLQKGARVYIEGNIHPQNWTDKEGISHKSHEVLVDKITFLSGIRAKESVTALTQ
jgi:single-strand DNA-binding protein